MTSLFTVRRRAEEFAAAVDRPPDQSADQAASHDTELVAVATLLRNHDPVTPRPEFALDLRERLMAEAETALAPQNAALRLPVRKQGARERRLVAAASAAVLIGGTASMAAAAQDALPGEMLYPVKRGIENAQAQLSLTTAGKGQALLSQASDRLTEVESLIAADGPADETRIDDTLSRFTVQADEGAQLLLESFTETQDPESIVTIRRFAAEGVATIDQITRQVPSEAQDELIDAAFILRDIDQQAVELCSSCAPGMPDLEVPSFFLMRAEVDRAMQGMSKLELDNSHPVTVDANLEVDRRAAERQQKRSSDARQPEREGGDGAVPAPVQPPPDAGLPDPAEPAPEPAPTAGPADQPAPKAPVDPPSDLVPGGLPDLDVSGPGPKSPDDPTKAPGKGKRGAGDVTDPVEDAVKTILPDPKPTDPTDGGPLP